MSLLKKQKGLPVLPSEFHITSHGLISAYGKEVPYAKFTAKVKKMPLGTINGIISVVDLDDNDSRILISASQNGKHSQLIAQQFFGQISR